MKVNKLGKPSQRRINLPGADKQALRTQFGAICYRVHQGKLQLLMITSRTARRWIVPKGWPIDGLTPAQSAAREAFEEAGVEGTVSEKCLGIYSYDKTRDGEAVPLVVALFPIRVRRLHAIFPEHGQRRRRWMSRKKAAASVDNPELRRLIRDFEPLSRKK